MFTFKTNSDNQTYFIIHMLSDFSRVIRICKSTKGKQHNGQAKNTKVQNTIYKTLQIKLEIE